MASSRVRAGAGGFVPRALDGGEIGERLPGALAIVDAAGDLDRAFERVAGRRVVPARAFEAGDGVERGGGAHGILCRFAGRQGARERRVRRLQPALDAESLAHLPGDRRRPQAARRARVERQRTLDLHPSRVRVAELEVDGGQIGHHRGRARLAVQLLEDQKAARDQIARAREIALRLADEAELVQGVGHAARLAERLAQREAPLVQLQRAAVVALKPVHGAETVEGRGGAAAVAAPLAHGQRALQMRDRAVVVADRPADEAAHVVRMCDAGFVAERLRRGARSRQEVAGRDEVASVERAPIQGSPGRRRSRAAA